MNHYLSLVFLEYKPEIRGIKNQRMEQDHWTELEKAIRAQLELQVRLSLDRHHKFMLKHGLAKCKPVVDIGIAIPDFVPRMS